MMRIALIALLAALPASAAPPEATQQMFLGFCSPDLRSFEDVGGPLLRSETMPANEMGIAAFTYHGTKRIGLGMILPDGVTYCMLWSLPVEGGGEPS